MTRFGAWRSSDHGADVSIVYETGASRFQRGRPIRPLTQRHDRLVVGWQRRLSMRASTGVTQQWAELRNQQTFIKQTGTRLWGAISSGQKHTLQVTMFRQSQRRTRPSPSPLSKTRGAKISLAHRISPEALIRVALKESRKTYRRRLNYLARAHQVRTRTFGVELVFTPTSLHNLQVVLTLDDRKISSPDPFDPSRTKTAILQFQWKLDRK